MLDQSFALDKSVEGDFLVVRATHANVLEDEVEFMTALYSAA